MFDISRIIRFLVLFFVSYGVIIFLFTTDALKPAVHGFYKNSSCNISSVLMSRADVISQFERQGNTVSYDRVVVRVGANQKEIDRRIAEARRLGLSEIKNPVCDIPFKPFEFFTVPLVFVFSLVLVTPMGFKKKLISILLAVLGMLIFLWLKFYIQILFSINFVYPIGMYELGSTGRSILEFLSQAMTMGLSIMVGVVLWLILSYKSLPLDRFKEAFKY